MTPINMVSRRLTGLDGSRWQTVLNWSCSIAVFHGRFEAACAAEATASVRRMRFGDCSRQWSVIDHMAQQSPVSLRKLTDYSVMRTERSRLIPTVASFARRVEREMPKMAAARLILPSTCCNSSVNMTRSTRWMTSS